MLLRKNVEIIQDAVGQLYLAINFSWEEIHFFMPKYYQLESGHEKFSANRRARDGKEFHLTFINAGEYTKLLKDAINNYQITNTLETILKDLVRLDLLGVGKSTKEESIAYYIVCKSETLNSFRKTLGLTDKDLHVTLGFNPKDIHGVDKKEIM